MHFSPEITHHIESAFEKCSPGKEDHEELLRLIYVGDHNVHPRFENFLHCIYKESGYSNDDGTVIVEKTASLFPDKEFMAKVLTKCNVVAETPPKTTYNAFICYQNYSKYTSLV